MLNGDQPVETIVPAESLGAAELYDAEYYRNNCGSIPYERSPHWLTFFGRIADELVRTFKPSSVLDAGCALGLLVEALWDHGVRAHGIDISRFALANVRPDIAPHCHWGSLVEPIEGRFDVVTCIEVLEHLESADAQAAVANICAAGDTILFSSTPTDFREPTHVNVCPPLVWIELFAAQGFGPDLAIDASFLTPHAFVVRKGNSTDRTTLQAAASLSRYRTLASERLEVIAVERHQTHLARLELSQVHELLNSEGARFKLEAAAFEAERTQRNVEAAAGEAERDAAQNAALNEVEALNQQIALLSEREDGASASLAFAHGTIGRLNLRVEELERTIATIGAKRDSLDPTTATQLQLLETLTMLQAANGSRIKQFPRSIKRKWLGEAGRQLDRVLRGRTDTT